MVDPHHTVPCEMTLKVKARVRMIHDPDRRKPDTDDVLIEVADLFASAPWEDVSVQVDQLRVADEDLAHSEEVLVS